MSHKIDTYKPMHTNVGKKTRRTGWIFALDELRRRIKFGVYRDQQKLPPERDLCLEFQISRLTLRKALNVLDGEGYIWRRVGQGTFVGSKPQEQTARADMPVNSSPQDILHARLVIEPAIAAHAATTSSPAQIEAMEQCLVERESASSPELYEYWDHRLHKLIAEATNNLVLIGIMDTLAELRRSSIWKKYRASTYTHERRHISAQQHREIVNAISARSPAAAYQAMHSHISTIQPNVMSILDALP
ncbi:FadR/GntR family transcriptional regulator [Mesorhizobium sp. 1B3]|uniref:FadR/GntR family transcriptional regulator n=1 Tax=Mesorhizobium sp. 1B3 TaxID=3243599 RepID=UPI003D97F7C7